MIHSEPGGSFLVPDADGAVRAVRVSPRKLFPWLAAALLLGGCADYAVTVQGIELDRLAGASSPEDQSAERGRMAARLNNAGVLSEREGDLAGALRLYRRALESDPGFVTAWVNSGNVQLQLGDQAQAERCYRAALELDPDQPRALNNLAWSYLVRQENLAEASALLDRAIAADPERRWLYLDSLGWSRYQEGKTDAALEILAEALAATPAEEDALLAETHYHLGCIRRERGENDAAISHFRQALAHAPGPEREREIRELIGRIPDGR